MQYREHDGFRISEIGVGCYALSGVYGEKDIQTFRAMLRRAFEVGVNFFDTADAYGDAEQVLGEVIKPYRDRVYLATKVGVKDGTKPDLSPAYVKLACEQSLQRLQTAYIDLYQVHLDDPETPVAETVGALEDLARQGKIRCYGVGHLPLGRVEAYIGAGNVFSVVLELSAAARDARQTLLPLCREHGVGAIAFSATGRGLLAGKYQPGHVFQAGDIRHIDPLFQRERFASGLRIAERLAEIGRRYGRTPVQAAIAWVLSQQGITCALTGPSTIAHLEENAAGSGWPFPPDALEQLEAFLRQEDA